MYLVVIGWIYVVLMMAVVEALSPNGTVLGAVFTFLLYGLIPLGIVMYIGLTPARKRAQRAAQSQADMEPGLSAPDGAGVTPGTAVAAERKET
jgi:hypothetical protein